MCMLVGSLLLVSPMTGAEASEPQDKVHRTVDDVLAIVANKALQPQERHTKIRQAVL
jgi:ABC-type transporter MlaC component